MSLIEAKSRLVERMKGGVKPLGIFVSCLDPAATDIMADAGFDFVVLDGEHGRFGRIEIEQHVRGAEAGGTIPLVRILENSQPLIQSILDVGAHGIVVPHVDTAADAAAAVKASLYSPAGARGMCPACRGGGYSLNGWDKRTRGANENVMVIPIIESARAVENIEEIVAVDGIDLVMFGPGDLAADMGLDLISQLDELMAAWHSVLNAVRAAGKFVMAPRGFKFDEADSLIVEMDLMILHRVASQIASEHKALFRDA